MEAQKFEVFQQMQSKGMSIAAAAESIGFDPALLSLYFAEDAYPVPKRILDKLTAALNS